jgi:large subunit ribosomal protein L31
MAKDGIHPDYHTINVVMTDGTKYTTRSTMGKEGDTLQLDVDPKTHPAWVGGVHLKKTGRLESFNSRFGAMAFKADAAKDAPKHTPKKTKPVVKKAAEPKAEKRKPGVAPVKGANPAAPKKEAAASKPAKEAKPEVKKEEAPKAE